MTRNAQLFTSDTAEHNTPRDVIDAIRDVFGGEIDLDPASNNTAQAYIKANRFCTLETAQKIEALGGMSTIDSNWHCKSLWLNPPFSIPTDRVNAKTGKPIRQRVIGDWVDRWLDAVTEREAAEAALLVPARTDTEWFAPLWGLPMCFIAGRLHFSGAENGATFPTVIVYAGGEGERGRNRFYARFAAFGTVGKFTR